MSGLIMEPSGSNAVTAIVVGGIRIGSRLLQSSFAVGAALLIEHIGVDHVTEMTEAQMDRLLETGADVILIGTGTHRRELPAVLLYRALSRGVGVEVMDNAAAARTYNLLLGESRNVLAVFLLPPDPGESARDSTL